MINMYKLKQERYLKKQLDLLLLNYELTERTLKHTDKLLEQYKERLEKNEPGYNEAGYINLLHKSMKLKRDLQEIRSAFVKVSKKL